MSIDQIRQLTAKNMCGDRHGRSDEEIVEAIRALRRGVSFRAVAKTMGFSDWATGTALRSQIGTWAIRSAVLPDELERGK